MNIKYRLSKTRANSDATSDYKVVGKFPVKLVDFLKWILESDNSFNIQIVSTNTCYGAHLELEMHKSVHDDKNNWHWVKKRPEWWFEDMAYSNVVECRANGGYGQMTYFCTFEE